MRLSYEVRKNENSRIYTIQNLVMIVVWVVASKSTLGIVSMIVVVIISLALWDGCVSVTLKVTSIVIISAVMMCNWCSGNNFVCSWCSLCFVSTAHICAIYLCIEATVLIGGVMNRTFMAIGINETVKAGNFVAFTLFLLLFNVAGVLVMYGILELVMSWCIVFFFVMATMWVWFKMLWWLTVFEMV